MVSYQPVWFRKKDGYGLVVPDWGLAVLTWYFSAAVGAQVGWVWNPGPAFLSAYVIYKCVLRGGLAMFTATPYHIIFMKSWIFCMFQSLCRRKETAWVVFLPQIRVVQNGYGPVSVQPLCPKVLWSCLGLLLMIALETINRNQICQDRSRQHPCIV